MPPGGTTSRLGLATRNESRGWAASVAAMADVEGFAPLHLTSMVSGKENHGVSSLYTLTR